MLKTVVPEQIDVGDLVVHRGYDHGDPMEFHGLVVGVENSSFFPYNVHFYWCDWGYFDSHPEAVIDRSPTLEWMKTQPHKLGRKDLSVLKKAG
jgi:hypothetical protein